MADSSRKSALCKVKTKTAPDGPLKSSPEGLLTLASNSKWGIKVNLRTKFYHHIDDDPDGSKSEALLNSGEQPPRKPKPKPKGIPKKPRPDFPLYPHPMGKWSKKIKGKIHYFTHWIDDPKGVEALKEYERDRVYLERGETPPSVSVREGMTLEELCEDFLKSKDSKREAGELSDRSFRDYLKSCQLLVNRFGDSRKVHDLKPDDFRALRADLSKRLGPVTLGNEINRISIVFNHAFNKHRSKIHGIETRKELFGGEFDKPSNLLKRRNKNEAGPKLFERDELLSILEASDDILEAMILLGLNCGFGNTDISSLPQSVIDFETGWIDFPRPKTEIKRRIPLWPETLEALQIAIAKRPKPKDQSDSDLCFLTNQGRRWVRVQERENQDDQIDFIQVVPIDALTQKFTRVMTKPRCRKCGSLQNRNDAKKCHQCEWKPTPSETWNLINGRRGLGFYSLRHTFETRAVPAKDQVAVDAIMGHVDSSMAANYRHGVPDNQLKAVVNTVRNWLFPVGQNETETDLENAPAMIS